MGEFDILPFILDISADKMVVTLTYTKENIEDGSANPTALYNVLTSNGVVFGVDKDVIDKAFTPFGAGKRIVIAKGLEPVNGQHGTVEYLFDQSKNLAPKDNGKGFVNYKDLGFVRNTVAGTIIANVTAPTAGNPGKTVFGDELPSKPGLEAKYKLGKNTELTEDGSQIVASIDGNLEWDGQAFIIAETLVINQDVGASTGNIDFIGDILIKGSVDENFTVISKKNISVNGTVCGATIISDGDVTVALGVIRSSIIAKGSVKINFAETAKVECEQNFVCSSCITCDVYCAGFLDVTAGKGVVLGGRITAVGGMRVNVLGSDKYTKTVVTLGKGAILAGERTSLIDKKVEIEQEITKLEQAGQLLSAQKKKLGTLPPDREAMLSQSIRQRFSYMRELKQFEARIKDVELSIREDSGVEIIVKKSLWNGVSISIGMKRIDIERQYTNHKVYLDVEHSGNIIIVPYAGK
jgi:uncharacterized protein (DUF342 family)